MGTVDERQRRRPADTNRRASEQRRRPTGEKRRSTDERIHSGDPKSYSVYKKNSSGEHRRHSSDARRHSEDANRHSVRERNQRNDNRRNKKKSQRVEKKATKILSIIELVISLIFFGFLWKLGMLPGKYMTVVAAGLLFQFAVCFGLSFGRKGSCITGIILSLFLSIVFAFGGYYLYKIDSAMGEVGGATYKTDNMVVAVRKEDKAKDIADAKGYQFGYQTLVDIENTNKMIQELNNRLNEEVSLTQFASVEELAQALLDGKIDAAIYNEAFSGNITETIADYESRIRILSQLGIHTKLEEEEKSVDKAFSVYISGIDVYGPITTNSRSDVNIIMTVNPDTKQILLTTTPRDYYVPIPGISGGSKDKLTHAGIYGVDRSMATLEQLYGIDIDYYARVNFTSLIKIIDVLGGVDVYSDYAFSAGGYSFKQGMNHMNGKAALAFSRERHSFAAGDNQRGKNQQAVITAILKKAMSPAILKNANSLLSSVSGSVETNMSKTEMSQLIRMQLDDGASWNITSVSATGTGDKKPTFSGGGALRYVMHPNMDSVSEIKGKMNQVINGGSVQ